jgi:hypothetical protein
MKYWNKDKEIRRRHWTKVKLDDGIPLWAPAVKERTAWCKKQKSSGKFYHYCHTWWFEYAEDATMFIMRWS